MAGYPIKPLSQGIIGHDGRVQAQPMLALLTQIIDAISGLWGHGKTVERPLDPTLGQLYYDTDFAALYVCTAVRAGAVPATWGPV